MQSEVLKLVDRYALSHIADHVLGLPGEWVMHVVVCKVGVQFRDALGNTNTVDNCKAFVFPLHSERQFCFILQSVL